MADAETVDDERTEKPEKRKIDLPCPIEKAQEEDEDKLDSSKRQKTETPSEKNGSMSVAAGENVAEMEEHVKIRAATEEEDEEDDDDYNAEQDEDGHEEAENVDRKGKGILLDDKGKGKMLADSEDDDSEDLDDDDDDDSSDDSDCDLPDGLDESDMEDDPLAEVDLDNILPSRTRQRRVQPGVRISSDSQKGQVSIDGNLALSWHGSGQCREKVINDDKTVCICDPASYHLQSGESIQTTVELMWRRLSHMLGRVLQNTSIG